MLIKNIDDLDERDQMFIDALLKRCADIRTAAQLATDFVAMIHREGSETLDSWIKRAWNPVVPQELRRFATSLKSEFNAVEAGLTTAWSNAQLEGQVNRLKLVKRQMYGRANYDLLRQRVLYAE